MGDLIGVGLYDRGEASRLTGVTSATIGRWTAGYTRAGMDYDPLWPVHTATEEALILDFRDLMELRAVAALRRPRPGRRRLGLQTLRKAIRIVEQRFGFSRPLSTLRFKTDGARLFFEHVEAADGEPALEDLFSGQRQLRGIIEQTLHDIDFADELPRLWWPMGRQAGIVVDPARAFGQPIEQETSIPTRTLALAFEVEGGVEAAARLYEVPARAVRRAVRFEHDYRAAA